MNSLAECVPCFLFDFPHQTRVLRLTSPWQHHTLSADSALLRHSCRETWRLNRNGTKSPKCFRGWKNTWWLKGFCLFMRMMKTLQATAACGGTSVASRHNYVIMRLVIIATQPTPLLMRTGWRLHLRKLCTTLGFKAACSVCSSSRCGAYATLSCLLAVNILKLWSGTQSLNCDQELREQFKKTDLVLENYPDNEG